MYDITSFDFIDYEKSGSSRNKLMFYSVIALFFIVLLQNFIPIEYLVYSLLYLITIFLYREKFVIVAVISTVISITSIFGESMRLLVQLNFIFTISVLVLIKYYDKKVKFSDFPVRLSPFLIMLFSTLIISTIFSDYKMTGLISIGKFILFFSMVIILYLNINSIKTIKLYFFGLFLAGLILSLGTIISLSLSGFDISDILQIAVLRTGGFIENVNAAGGFFAILIPLSYTFYLIEEKKGKANLYFTAFLIFFLGLIISNSRAAFLSLLVTFIVFFYNYKRVVIKRFALYTAVIILLIYFIKPLNEFFSIILRIESGFSHREPLWEMTAGIIKDHYLFGVGPGAYGHEMFNYFPVLLDSWVGEKIIHLFEVTKGANASHIFYIGFLSDMGILGLITAAFLPVVFLKICLENISFFKQNKKMYLLNLGIFSIGSGLFIRAFFDSVNIMTYGYVTNDLPFWILFITIIYLNMNKLKLQNAQF